MTLHQAREIAFAEFPGLQELYLYEGPPFTITVFAKPREFEVPIREHLRLQGAVMLYWKTGDEFRWERAKDRMVGGTRPLQAA